MSRFHFYRNQLSIYYPSEINFGSVFSIALCPKRSFLTYFIIESRQFLRNNLFGDVSTPQIKNVIVS